MVMVMVMVVTDDIRRHLVWFSIFGQIVAIYTHFNGFLARVAWGSWFFSRMTSVIHHEPRRIHDDCWLLWIKLINMIYGMHRAITSYSNSLDTLAHTMCSPPLSTIKYLPINKLIVDYRLCPSCVHLFLCDWNFNGKYRQKGLFTQVSASQILHIPYSMSLVHFSIALFAQHSWVYQRLYVYLLCFFFYHSKFASIPITNS